MPLTVGTTRIGPPITIDPSLRPPDDEEISYFADVVPAAARWINPIFSALSNELPERIGRTNEIDPFFDPYPEIEGTQYEEFSSAFRDVFNRQDFELKKAAIDQELDDRQTVIAAGIPGFVALFAAGLLDPILLLPFGKAVQGIARFRQVAEAVKTGKALERATAFGPNILQGAALNGFAGFSAVGASEALLQATQDTRTHGESIINISAGTFLTAVLGGVGAALSVGARREAIATVGRELGVIRGGIGPEDIPITKADVDASTGGAAPKTGTDSAENFALRRSWGFAPVISRMSPGLRLGQLYPFRAAKLAAARLIRVPYIYESNALGKVVQPGGSVEALIDFRTLSTLPKVLEGVQNLYFVGKTGKAGNFFTQNAQRAKELASRLGNHEPAIGELLEAEWHELVGRLVRDSPLEETIRAPGPGDQARRAAEAANLIRDEMLTPILKEAVELGILPKELFESPGKLDGRTALGYLMRLYNRPKIRQFRGTDKSIEVPIKNWLRDEFFEATEDELTKAASDAVDQILHIPLGRVGYEPIEVSIGGSLHKRALLVPDKLLDPWLITDVRKVLPTYMRGIVPDLELVRAFRVKGVKAKPEKGIKEVKAVSIEDALAAKPLIDDINAEFAVKLKELDARVTKEKIKEKEAGKLTTKLGNQRKKANQDVLDMRDMLRGTFRVGDPEAPWQRSVRSIKHFNHTTIGGGFAVSSVADIANIIGVNGMVRSFRAGLIPLITNWKGFNIARSQLKDFGIGTEFILNRRTQILRDINDDYGIGTVAERALAGVSAKFSIANLLVPWNASIKQIAGVVVQARILEASARWRDNKIGLQDKILLTSAGIDRPIAIRIAELFDQHGTRQGGGLGLGTIKISNTDDWTKAATSTAQANEIRRIRDTFRRAILNDVETIIVTPGVGDRPTWMSDPEKNVFGQFKSFAFSATSRALLMNIQRLDEIAFINWFAHTTALGMLVFYLKSLQARRPLPDDLATWVKEGIDRGGATGFVMDVNNIMEKVTGGTVGISAVLGGPTASRYASRNIVGALAGPSIGRLQSFAEVTSALSRRDLTRGNTKTIRRLAPYNNVFYLSKAFDALEDGANDAFGIPKRNKRRSRGRRVLR